MAARLALGLPWIRAKLDTIMHSDLRFAIRQWFKDPGFAAINVLTLAVVLATAPLTRHALFEVSPLDPLIGAACE